MVTHFIQFLPLGGSLGRPSIGILLVLFAGCGRSESRSETSGGTQPRSSQATDTIRSRIDSTELARIIDSAMAQGMAGESIPGAAFILVDKGRVVLAKGYGHSDAESRRAWNPAGTIFPIASVTKVFTATAVMQLVDRGQVELNADVNRYLSSARVSPTYPQPVTAAHLLSHTGGFDELPGRRAESEAEVVPLGRFLTGRLVRVHPPGEITSYSSYGAALAGLLVQDVSGLSFEEYLRRHIWQPLGMTRTSITPPGDGTGLATASVILKRVGRPSDITPPPFRLCGTVNRRFSYRRFTLRCAQGRFYRRFIYRRSIYR